MIHSTKETLSEPLMVSIEVFRYEQMLKNEMLLKLLIGMAIDDDGELVQREIVDILRSIVREENKA